MSKKKRSRAFARLISFILAFSLVFVTGSLFVPETASYADTDPAPVLRICQDLKTEDGLKAPDLAFKYRLSAAGVICPLPEGSEGTNWDFKLTGDEEMSIHFLAGLDTASSSEVPIRFTGKGIYRYTLSQYITDKKANITYDENIYDIYVKVSGRNGLKVEAVWAQRDTGDKPESILFTNIIGKASVIGDPPVNVVKRIEGDVPTKKDKFVFVMSPDRDDFPLPYGAKGSYEVTLYGEGEVEIGNIEFDATGTYSYRVYEKATLSSVYTYDRTVFRVIYKVNLEEDGTMSCTRQIINEDKTAEKCVFTNKYTSPQETPQGDTRKKDPPSAGDPNKNDTPASGDDDRNDTPASGDIDRNDTPAGSDIDKDGDPSDNTEKKNTPKGNGGTRTGDATPRDALAMLMFGAFVMILSLSYRRRKI